tara:strand:+ start:37440 stop:38186 length:747 start_codon:yes stop_codon:yes gene_type:complete
MSITKDRAVKRAYFSNLEGGNIVEFQFSPASLQFKEGGKFEERIKVGNYFPELIWISGDTNAFELRFFIDRTQESYVRDEYNSDPFEDFKRFPEPYTKYVPSQVYALIAGAKQDSDVRKNGAVGGGIQPSSYSASPHYAQSSFNDNVGVLKDLEALMYFLRPQGIELGDISISESGEVNINDFSQNRFTPPPMFRFYYGSIWREGYFTNIEYQLSAMNKQLVPNRLDATIKMACSNWGYLSELNNELS